jgi:hypothetical protein
MTVSSLFTTGAAVDRVVTTAVTTSTDCQTQQIESLTDGILDELL